MIENEMIRMRLRRDQGGRAGDGRSDLVLRETDRQKGQRDPKSRCGGRIETEGQCGQGRNCINGGSGTAAPDRELHGLAPLASRHGQMGGGGEAREEEDGGEEGRQRPPESMGQQI